MKRDKIVDARSPIESKTPAQICITAKSLAVTNGASSSKIDTVRPVGSYLVDIIRLPASVRLALLLRRSKQGKSSKLLSQYSIVDM